MTIFFLEKKMKYLYTFQRTYLNIFRLIIYLFLNRQRFIFEKKNCDSF